MADDELAIEPLERLGWEVKTISWRDETVDWDEFFAVIIRTTWDYQKSPAEFLEVLRRIDRSKTRLENSLKTVEWNLSKLYLRELESRGVKIVPTIWGEEKVSEAKFEEWRHRFETNEIILKPIISWKQNMGSIILKNKSRQIKKSCASASTLMRQNL